MKKNLVEQRFLSFLYVSAVLLFVFSQVLVFGGDGPSENTVKRMVEARRAIWGNRIKGLNNSIEIDRNSLDRTEKELEQFKEIQLDAEALKREEEELKKLEKPTISQKKRLEEVGDILRKSSYRRYLLGYKQSLLKDVEDKNVQIEKFRKTMDEVGEKDLDFTEKTLVGVLISIRDNDLWIITLDGEFQVLGGEKDFENYKEDFASFREFRIYNLKNKAELSYEENSPVYILDLKAIDATDYINKIRENLKEGQTGDKPLILNVRASEGMILEHGHYLELTSPMMARGEIYHIISGKDGMKELKKYVLKWVKINYVVIYNKGYIAPIYCHVIDVTETKVPEKFKEWYEYNKNIFKNGVKLESSPSK